MTVEFLVLLLNLTLIVGFTRLAVFTVTLLMSYLKTLASAELYRLTCLLHIKSNQINLFDNTNKNTI